MTAWTRPDLQTRDDVWDLVSKAVHRLDLACSPWPGTPCKPELVAQRLVECEEALDTLRLTWGL